MSKKHIHLVIGLVIIALSLFYAFRGVNLSELKDALFTVQYFFLVPAIALVVVSYVFRAMRWKYLVRSITEVSTGELVSPMMVGFMANMLPARAGEFIRAYLLSQKKQISFSSSFATIFIERLFDLMMVLLLLVIALLFMPEAFISADGAGSYDLLDKVKLFGLISFTLCLFILLFSLFLQYKHEWTMKVVGFFVKPLPTKWRQKIIGMVTSFSEGLNIIKDRRGFIATVLLSFLIWGTFVFTYYPLYHAFGIASQLPMSSLVVLCLTVAIFITVAPTPGFLGSYHLGCVAALHGIFGIEKAVALSYGIVAWLVAMGTTVVIGAVFAVKDNISVRDISAGKEQLE